MGEVNFYLNKPEGKGKDQRSLIYLQYKYNGRKLVFSFGQNIHPDNWNKNKQRVKGNVTTTGDGKHLVNDLLDNLKKVCETAYNTELKNGIPTPAMVRKHLLNFINQNDEDLEKPSFCKLVDRFISGEIQHEGRDKSPNTIKIYNTLLKLMIPGCRPDGHLISPAPA